VDSVSPGEKAPPADRSPGLAEKLHPLIFALFLIQFALVCARLWLRDSLFGDHEWPEAVLLLLAVASLAVSLARLLPAQNVMAAALIIAFIGSCVQAIGALTGIPFGPFVYTDRFVRESFRLLPGAVPLMWVVAILSSRGVARLIMRPWRRMRTYGFWVIGITAALVVVLDIGLEPFATRVMHYWFWNPTRIPLDWYGAPCVNFIGWALTALLIMVIVTPFLINKHAAKQPPTYHPLVVWVLIVFLFAAAAVAHRLWPVALLVTGAGGVVAAFALRGAAW
jgi:putative membrane protein